jgi:hypothetical protein
MSFVLPTLAIGAEAAAITVRGRNTLWRMRVIAH